MLAQSELTHSERPQEGPDVSTASDLKLVSPHLLAPCFQNGLVRDVIDLEDLGHPMAGSTGLDKMTGKIIIGPPDGVLLSSAGMSLQDASFQHSLHPYTCLCDQGAIPSLTEEVHSMGVCPTENLGP